jgi:hypothetical protein
MTASVSEQTYVFESGTPDIASVGPITFSPDGILFLADNANAKIVAIDVRGGDQVQAPINVDNLDARLAGYLGCGVADIQLRDMAVHPVTNEVYFSLTRGAGSAASPLIVKVDGVGAITEVALEDVRFAETAIEDAPSEDDERVAGRIVPDGSSEGEDFEIESMGLTIRLARERLRTVTVTDLAFVDGTLLVAGASNEEFSSSLRRIPFPFGGRGSRSSLEIFHTSHGKWETASPINKFVPFDGGRSILASYTCTPVVRFQVADLEPGAHVVGSTVAELGPVNTPLDIVAYEDGGLEYLLVSNTRHPLLKLSCGEIDEQPALTDHADHGGLPRTDLPHPGVSHMAIVNGDHVLMVQRDDNGTHLRSYSTASI